MVGKCKMVPGYDMLGGCILLPRGIFSGGWELSDRNEQLAGNQRFDGQLQLVCFGQVFTMARYDTTIKRNCRAERAHCADAIDKMKGL